MFKNHGKIEMDAAILFNIRSYFEIRIFIFMSISLIMSALLGMIYCGYRVVKG